MGWIDFVSEQKDSLWVYVFGLSNFSLVYVFVSLWSLVISFDMKFLIDFVNEHDDSLSTCESGYFLVFVSFSL